MGKIINVPFLVGGSVLTGIIGAAKVVSDYYFPSVYMSLNETIFSVVIAWGLLGALSYYYGEKFKRKENLRQKRTEYFQRS